MLAGACLEQCRRAMPAQYTGLAGTFDLDPTLAGWPKGLAGTKRGPKRQAYRTPTNAVECCAGTIFGRCDDALANQMLGGHVIVTMGAEREWRWEATCVAGVPGPASCLHCLAQRTRPQEPRKGTAEQHICPIRVY